MKKINCILPNTSRFILFYILMVFSGFTSAENNIAKSMMEKSPPPAKISNEIQKILGIEGEFSTKTIPGAAFAPLDGGAIDMLNGCLVSRPTLPSPLSGPDLDMYAPLSLPIGSSIVGMSGYFFDIAHYYDARPSVILQRHDGLGIASEITIVQSPDIYADFPGYYEIVAEIDPNYIVQKGDFFNLLFTAARGDTTIVNAYWICGVEVFYQLNK